MKKILLFFLFIAVTSVTYAQDFMLIMISGKTQNGCTVNTLSKFIAKSLKEVNVFKEQKRQEYGSSASMYIVGKGESVVIGEYYKTASATCNERFFRVIISSSLEQAREKMKGQVNSNKDLKEYDYWVSGEN